MVGNQEGGSMPLRYCVKAFSLQSNEEKYLLSSFNLITYVVVLLA